MHQPTSKKRRTDPPCSVGGRTVDLGEIFSGEGTSTVRAPATIRVNDDLSASQASITLRTANNESSRRLNLRKRKFRTFVPQTENLVHSVHGR
jgi:hypothetical protein